MNKEEFEAFTMPKAGEVPKQSIKDELWLEDMVDHSCSGPSGKLSRLLKFLKDTNTPFEFHYNDEYEHICIPCLPDNNEQSSVILVFEKNSGNFKDLLINGNSLNPEHNNRRHNLPNNIHKKIIKKCINTIKAYIHAYSKDSPRNQSDTTFHVINDKELLLFNEIIENHDLFVKRMGLKDFVEYVNNLIKPWTLDSVLNYINRHNIS